MILANYLPTGGCATYGASAIDAAVAVFLMTTWANPAVFRAISRLAYVYVPPQAPYNELIVEWLSLSDPSADGTLCDASEQPKM